jgi:DnaK suppressor protein
MADKGLTSKQIKELAQAMRGEMEELKTLSAQTRDDRAPVSLDQQSVGRLSRMDAIQQQSMDLAREERRQMRLNTLTAAIERLEGGSEYGACLVCGDDIPYKRLKADPAAVRCVDCAE